MADRYEINHDGKIVQADTELCADREKILQQLFTQYGWTYEVLSKEGSCYTLALADPNGNTQILNVYTANLRNESRNPYEKKGQTNLLSDPSKRDKANTIILGIYVFKEHDTAKDAIFVGFPIAVRGTNSSMRGVQINKLLVEAKTKGFVYDKEHNNVGFRAEFIFYYLQNYYALHYEGKRNGEEAEIELAETPAPIRYHTGLESEFSRNRIVFGAPGTGKSFSLNQEKEKLLKNGGDYERVTFHPDYSYANFVGTYKPVPVTGDEGNAITYAYVPGPFMRVYAKALISSRTDHPKPYLLLIEEINRANVAAVFGDIFQLLDRDDEEKSQYPIQVPEDIKKYLTDELGGTADQYAQIRIPDNMFIWATMNSADQGVFPMDTAFKRRWDFTYLGIDDNEEGIAGKKVMLGTGSYAREVEWNKLRKEINAELARRGVNEDKLMGPYFIGKKDLPADDQIDANSFAHIFKNKVIMYLFEDAAKQKRKELFEGCNPDSRNQYSKICAEFDEKGVNIFCSSIRNQFLPKGDA